MRLTGWFTKKDPPDEIGGWVSFIRSVNPDSAISAPASESEVLTVEQQLDTTLPDDLRSLLLESNGVRDDVGASFVWPCSEIVKENLELRTEESYRDLYEPFDRFLFFGSDGCGNLYGYSISETGNVTGSDIMFWDHESDERYRTAVGLRAFLKESLTPVEDD